MLFRLISSSPEPRSPNRGKAAHTLTETVIQLVSLILRMGFWDTIITIRNPQDSIANYFLKHWTVGMPAHMTIARV